MTALAISASMVLYKNELSTIERSLLALQVAAQLARQHYEFRLKLTLVDNSNDVVLHRNLADWLEGFRPSVPELTVHLIGAQGNIGYGRGNNLVITSARSDYHIVINPDLFVDATALLEAIRYMEVHRDVGLLSPAVFGDDGERHYLCKRNPTLLVMFLRSFAPKWLSSSLRSINDKFEMRDCNYEESIHPLEYPTGCFMFFRTAPLQAIGGFDSDFFLHFEDADIGRRMLKVARVVYVPTVRVVHQWARDTHHSMRAIFITVRSGLLYWLKWGGAFRSKSAVDASHAKYRHQQPERLAPVLAFVANQSFSLYQFRGAVIRKMVQDGIRVICVAPDDGYREQLEALGCQFVPISFSARGRNPFADIYLLLRLILIYRRIAPSFVYHYTVKPNIYGSIAAAVVGVPSVAVVTGLGYTFINDRWVSSVARALYKLALHFPREVWFLNRDDADEFILRRLVSEHLTRVIPGEGIDVGHYSKASCECLDTAADTVLMVGRMLWDKGVGEFVEAARILKGRYPEIRFKLLGPTGAENPSAIPNSQVIEWASDGFVEYLGSINDIRPDICRSICVVLPSYREGLPRVLLEAAAMERPLVATDVPGCRDIVQNGITGFLCEPRDITSLIEAIERVIRLSVRQRADMGRAGRELVERKYSDNMVALVYEECLGKFGVILPT